MPIEWEHYLSHNNRVFPLPKESDITLLQQFLGVALPEDYKQLLRHHQGQTPYPDAITIWPNQSKVLGCLLHVYLCNIDMTYSIVEHTQLLYQAGYENYVPFIDDTDRALFCFDYNPLITQEPPIVLISLDGTAQCVQPVARNLTEFLDLLEEGV